MAKPAAPREKSPPPRPPASKPAPDGLPGVADVEGRMKKRAASKLTQLVTDHPDEAVGALRRWLHDGD